MSQFEELLSWLLREEETVGITRITRATLDIEEARELLRSELYPFEPTERQVSGFMQAGEWKYEFLPQLGIEIHPVKEAWGTRYRYYSTVTKEWVGIPDVVGGIRALMGI